MRTVLRVVLLTILVVAAAADAPAAQVRRRHRRIVTPREIMGSAAGAAVGQARNVPHEWGQGAAGFGARFASSLGTHAVKRGIEFGVGKMFHENLHYQRSNLHGTFPRMKYAVKRTFFVPKTNRPGKRTLSKARLSGAIGSGLISRAWQPASTAGLGSAFASGGIALGADVGVNMAHEFWPRKHRRVAHRHRVRLARR